MIVSHAKFKCDFCFRKLKFCVHFSSSFGLNFESITTYLKCILSLFLSKLSVADDGQAKQVRVAAQL